MVYLAWQSLRSRPASIKEYPRLPVAARIHDCVHPRPHHFGLKGSSLGRSRAPWWGTCQRGMRGSERVQMRGQSLAHAKYKKELFHHTSHILFHTISQLAPPRPIFHCLPSFLLFVKSKLPTSCLGGVSFPSSTALISLVQPGETSKAVFLTDCLLQSYLDEAQDAHQQVYGGEHEAKFSHELLAGGAAFEGMKLFEDHQRKEGLSPLTSWD